MATDKLRCFLGSHNLRFVHILNKIILRIMSHFCLEKVIIGRHSVLIFTRFKLLCSSWPVTLCDDFCHCSAVKDDYLEKLNVRFCSLASSQIMESLMTEKLNLHCYEQCFSFFFF